MRKYFSFFVLALAFFVPLGAFAQSNLLETLPGEGSTVSILLSPANPAPNSVVALSAQSSFIDLSNSSLTWYVNGKIVAQGQGVTSAQATTGAVGSQTSVEVDVATPDGTSASARVAIIPTTIDLLFDSDSYVPPFYQGRALPSAGTDMRLEAIAHFMRPDGSSVAPANITYTWRQNGRVVGSASGRGKYYAVLPSPALFGTDTILVSALSSDGTLSGSASIVVPSVEPVLMLYEDHPLFGMMYHQALGAETIIPDSEMTFAAVPYFAEIVSPNDARLVYAWTVNDSKVAANASDPSEITVNAAKSDGIALIGLDLTHSQNFFMDSSGSWQVTLSGTAAAPSATGASGGLFGGSGQ